MAVTTGIKRVAIIGECCPVMTKSGISESPMSDLSRVDIQTTTY